MLYQHMDPAVVGNDMRMLVSDMAGRANIELKGRELGFDLAATATCSAGSSTGSRTWRRAATRSRRPTRPSSCCCAKRSTATGAGFFEVESWRVIVERAADGRVSEATVKVHAGGERIVATGEGNGPVNALDHALRSRWSPSTRSSASSSSSTTRCASSTAAHGTDAVTRVLVETSDGETSWETVGVHANMIEASWEALLDAVTFGLLRHGRA
jgi:2-isopropylmalate synthase